MARLRLNNAGLAGIPFRFGMALRRLASFRPVAVLLAEREQWFLWLPVLLGGGIAIYFGLAREPSLSLLRTGMALAAAAPILALLLRRREWAIGLLAPLLVLAGLWLSAERAAGSAAPVLERRTGAIWLEGRVVRAEPRDNGHRLTLEALRFENWSADRTPARIRIGLPRGGEEIQPGDRLRLRAVLMPPPDPAMPGAFDFARQAWFQRLGAVGFVVGLPEKLIPEGELGPMDSFRVMLARAQQDITRRITAVLDGADGAIAAALMTGVRGPIPEEVDDAFRDSGLAHILSISGLHLALVAGILFFAVRALLALVPALALHYPIKKWAAIVALIGAAAYMLLSGSALATQRSFIMVALAFGAILVDRRAISLRSLAVAALLLLLLAPESLLDAGFQMSFAAVAALIAAFEAAEPTLTRLRQDAGPLRTALLWLAVAMLSSFVAGLGSGLIAAYHFNRIADYALFANLIASPLVTFIIMPLAMLAFALMLVGLEALALTPMGWAVEALIWIAEWVAGWPGAVGAIPAMPGWTLPALGLGLAWLCLWKLRWRWLGVLPIMAAMAAPFFVAPPDIVIAGDARLVALRGQESGEGARYYFSAGRAAQGVEASGFAAETWWRRLGNPDLLPWPILPRRGPNAEGMTSADGTIRCERSGCTARLKGWVIALPKEERTLAEDCRGADIVIAPFPVRRRCPSARVVLDRFDLWRNGSHALWLGADTRLRAENAAAGRGARPWVPKRGHGAMAEAPPDVPNETGRRFRRPAGRGFEIPNDQ